MRSSSAALTSAASGCPPLPRARRRRNAPGSVRPLLLHFSPGDAASRAPVYVSFKYDKTDFVAAALFFLWACVKIFFFKCQTQLVTGDTERACCSPAGGDQLGRRGRCWGGRASRREGLRTLGPRGEGGATYLLLGDRILCF